MKKVFSSCLPSIQPGICCRPAVCYPTGFPTGNHLADLFTLSAVQPLLGRDDTTSVETWQVEEQSAEQIVFELKVSSSVWRSKTYRFRCQPHRFSYEIEIEGEGQLAEVDYFGGYFSGQLRWGSGYFWSGKLSTRASTRNRTWMKRTSLHPLKAVRSI